MKFYLESLLLSASVERLSVSRMRDFSLQTSWTQVQHSTQHTCEEPLHLRVLCIGCRDKQISKIWDLLGPTALMRKEAVLLYTIQYCTKHTCEDSPYTSLSGESIVCQRLGYISQRCHPEPEKNLAACQHCCTESLET